MDKIFNVKINGKDLDKKFPINYIEVNNLIVIINMVMLDNLEMDIDNDLLVARQSREKQPFWVKMAT